MREVERLVPSLTMGEYITGVSRPDGGGLYPLAEEGMYGRVPKKEYQARWTGPQPYVKRERKTKMYASYAISDKCELHALVLGKYDRRSKEQTRRPMEPQSRSCRAVSAPPEFQQSVNQTMKTVERRPSLPSTQNNGEMEEMISKLNIKGKVGEDNMESLRSLLGEEEVKDKI
eukprot:GFUD01003653.1.p1 GENE.GFUD01003653.1~~GFUD01003653.1.p1  ORF type:complete len:173 (+),score=50.23 GFUD01003653.1:20-538(+)